MKTSPSGKRTRNRRAEVPARHTPMRGGVPRGRRITILIFIFTDWTSTIMIICIVGAITGETAMREVITNMSALKADAGTNDYVNSGAPMEPPRMSTTHRAGLNTMTGLLGYISAEVRNTITNAIDIDHREGLTVSFPMNMITRKLAYRIVKLTTIAIGSTLKSGASAITVIDTVSRPSTGDETTNRTAATIITCVTTAQPSKSQVRKSLIETAINIGDTINVSGIHRITYRVFAIDASLFNDCAERITTAMNGFAIVATTRRKRKCGGGVRTRGKCKSFSPVADMTKRERDLSAAMMSQGGRAMGGIQSRRAARS